jgi:hypothetical protein
VVQWAAGAGGAAADQANGVVADGGGSAIVGGSVVSNPATFFGQSVVNSGAAASDVFVVSTGWPSGCVPWRRGACTPTCRRARRRAPPAPAGEY